jgi:hypothetical protein
MATYPARSSGDQTVNYLRAPITFALGYTGIAQVGTSRPARRSSQLRRRDDGVQRRVHQHDEDRHGRERCQLRHRHCARHDRRHHGRHGIGDGLHGHADCRYRGHRNLGVDRIGHDGRRGCRRGRISPRRLILPLSGGILEGGLRLALHFLRKSHARWPADTLL